MPKSHLHDQIMRILDSLNNDESEFGLEFRRQVLWLAMDFKTEMEDTRTDKKVVYQAVINGMARLSIPDYLSELDTAKYLDIKRDIIDKVLQDKKQYFSSPEKKDIPAVMTQPETRSVTLANRSNDIKDQAKELLHYMERLETELARITSDRKLEFYFLQLHAEAIRTNTPLPVNRVRPLTIDQIEDGIINRFNELPADLKAKLGEALQKEIEQSAASAAAAVENEVPHSSMRPK